MQRWPGRYIEANGTNSIIMAQASYSKRLGTGVTIYHDKNLNVSTTATFTTALDIVTSSLRESTFVIHNKGSGDLDYQILGNLDVNSDITLPTGTDDDDAGWIVLKASTTIGTGIAPAVETLSNPYTRILIQIKHTTLTTNVNLYHRGQS